MGGSDVGDPPQVSQAVPPLLLNLIPGEHIVESTWEDPERDAEIGRKFNLWSSGCRGSKTPRHHTPPVVLSMPDVLTRLTTQTTKRWGTFTHSQKELIGLARRTLFELRVAAATRRLQF